MRHSQRDRAVSPVVAVILMVAITVILSAVIGTFVLNLGQQTTSGASENKLGVKITTDGTNLTATIVTGTADKAKLLVNGTEVDNLTNPSAGDRLTALSVHSDADVTVVSVREGESTVVLSSSGVTQPTHTVGSGPLYEDSLIHHYAIERGSGSTVIDSAGSANGTLRNGSWVSSSRGDVIHLPGNLDAKVNETGATQLSSPWTFSVWTNGTMAHATSVHLASNSDYSIKFEQYSETGKLGFTNYGVADYTFSNAPTPTGAWSHIVFVNNGSHTLVYVNGTHLDTHSTTIPLPIAQYGAVVKGELDDIRVYNRTLNDSEISTLYSETK